MMEKVRWRYNVFCRASIAVLWIRSGTTVVGCIHMAGVAGKALSQIIVLLGVML